MVDAVVNTIGFPLVGQFEFSQRMLTEKEGKRTRKREEQGRVSLPFSILLVSFQIIVTALPSSTAFYFQLTPFQSTPLHYSYTPSLGTTFTDPRSHSPFRTITDITSHLITSHHILSYLITSHPITSQLISSHLISSHHTSSHHILSYLITSHPITSHLISSHLISSHHTSSHHTPYHRIGGPAGSMKGGRQIEASKEILSEKNVPYIVAAPLLIQGN